MATKDERDRIRNLATVVLSAAGTIERQAGAVPEPYQRRILNAVEALKLASVGLERIVE